MHKELHTKKKVIREVSIWFIFTFVAVKAHSFYARHSGLNYEQKVKYFYYFPVIKDNSWLSSEEYKYCSECSRFETTLICQQVHHCFLECF